LFVFSEESQIQNAHELPEIRGRTSRDATVLNTTDFKDIKKKEGNFTEVYV